MALHGRMVGVGLLAAALLATGCGDDSGNGGDVFIPDPPDSSPPVRRDSGPLPDLPRMPDAGMLIPGEPPPELADSACAVDTNKLFELVTTVGNPMPATVAVDLFESRFGVGFVDEASCLDGAFVAELMGPSGSGEPDVTEAFDECSTIEQIAIGHNTTEWLIATIDNRMDQAEIWVQAYRPGVGSFPPNRISESTGEKTQVAVAGLPPDRAMVAWTERDPSDGTVSLWVRALDAEGVPQGDAIAIEEETPPSPSDLRFYSPLTMSRIGESRVGLGYIRSDLSFGPAILQVLDHDGNPVHALPLAEDGPIGGTIDLATDETGGGVLFARAPGTDARQLWFQQLGPDGQPFEDAIDGLGQRPPERIVGSPNRAIDGSMAQLPSGFAVIYRALEGGRTFAGEERIMLQVLNRFGGITNAPAPLALAQPVGGKTSAKAAFDGRVVAAWNDVDPDGVRTLTAVRLPCFGAR